MCFVLRNEEADNNEWVNKTIVRSQRCCQYNLFNISKIFNYMRTKYPAKVRTNICTAYNVSLMVNCGGWHCG